MRIFLLVLIFGFLAGPTMADPVFKGNPFDEQACTGPMMSSERALELLGSEARVGLIDGSTYSELPGTYRMRQKIRGATGPWHESRYDVGIKPYLYNANGEIGLSISYYPVDENQPIEFSCSLSTSGDAFTCRSHLSRLVGSGQFVAKLTDNCFRMVSTQSTNAVDEEWAYLMQF